MMKRILLLLIFVVTLPVCFSQKSNEVLLTIGGEKVTSDEFLRIYNKNNNIENQVDPKTIDEYLELFINFKLKVIEAESLGMDTLASFINELSGYREQLTKPYLRDDSFDELLIEEAYKRTTEEVHASHIIVRIDEFAPPKDTLRAYEKIMSIRQRIMEGEAFDVVAKATSDDPSVQQNGGDLGYFSAFRMVYPFETAAYSTPVGEVSMPLRTRFGYHILKVHDRRPSLGSVQVAHIMVATPEIMNPEQLENARKKALNIYEQIIKGEDFSELAKKYSDDKGSGNNGGALRWFSTGQMVPEFEKAAFELKEIGEVSHPIKTSYGWHIIKLLDKKPVPSFEETKQELAQKIKRDRRNKVGETVFIEKLKDEYNYSEDQEALADFFTVVDSSIFNTQWDITKASHLNKTLFTLNGQEFTQKDFTNYLASAKSPSKPINTEAFIKNTFDRFVHNIIIDYEKSRLEIKYPEFRYLMEEYHDGILLFDLTDKLVWSKAVEDTIGLEKFYEENKTNYMWGERLDAVIFAYEDETILPVLQKIAKKGVKKNYSPEFIKQSVCDTLDCLSISSDKFEKGENELIDKVSWSKGIFGPFNDGGINKIVMVKQVISPEPKKINEAKGIITADYQNYLEQEWVKKLRSKYEISVNQDVLSKLKEEEANL